MAYLVLPRSQQAWVELLLAYSGVISLRGCSLLELAGYHVTRVGGSLILLALWQVAGRAVVGLITGGSRRTVEGLRRNARWLERELAEMHGAYIVGKRDRRALFLLGALYWGVLEKAFPVQGFFELSLGLLDGRLLVTHVC